MNKTREEVKYYIEKESKEMRSIKQSHLSLLCHVTAREIRHIVRDLRLEGVPIGSNDKGYFLAKSKEELEHTINKLLSQNRKHIDLMLALEKCFD